MVVIYGIIGLSLCQCYSNFCRLTASVISATITSLVVLGTGTGTCEKVLVARQSHFLL